MDFPSKNTLPFLSPGDPPDPEISEPTSPALQADPLLLSHQGSIYIYINTYTNIDELQVYVDFPGGSVVKNPASAGDARDMTSIPGLGKSPGEGNGNPLQYSCLETSMDRGA